MLEYERTHTERACVCIDAEARTHEYRVYAQEPQTERLNRKNTHTHSRVRREKTGVYVCGLSDWFEIGQFS